MTDDTRPLVHYQDRTFQKFISSAEIDKIISDLAAQINAEYEAYQLDILLISILDGSFMFMADLVRKLSFPHKIHFVKLASYEDTSTTGEVKYIMDLQVVTKDKHVLVIEDIIDTGLTLESFMTKIAKTGPLSLKVCTLLSKPEVHNDIVKVDFVGKEISPVFIIGYGLDINGEARNLPDIYKLKI